MTLYGYRVPMMASLLVWCVVWELVGQSGLMFLVPPLSSVLVGRRHAWCRPAPGRAAALITLHSFAIGMAFAIVVGVTLGVLMGRFKAVDELFGIWVNIFVSAPLSALVPVLMILFGMGETTVIVTVFLFAVWIIVLDTRAGIQHVPNSLIEMGRSYGASTFALYGKIVLLAALPEILAGIRLGLVRGVKGVVIGQLLVAIIGYGELFELYSRSFDMENFWALTIILFAAAMLMSAAIEHIEKKVDYYAGVR